MIINPSSAGIAGTLGGTDNAVPRADGTGGSTLQGSLVRISDTGTLILPGGLTVQFGVSGEAGYEDGVGHYFTDISTTTFKQQHNVSNYSANRTIAWPNVAGTVVLGGATSTGVGAAGGSDALPATPLGYLTITLPGGGTAKLPYYNT